MPFNVRFFPRSLSLFLLSISAIIQFRNDQKKRQAKHKEREKRKIENNKTSKEKEKEKNE